MPTKVERRIKLAIALLAERYGVFGAPCTVAEVARRHRLSRPQVRALEGRAVSAIRRAVGA